MIVVIGHYIICLSNKPKRYLIDRSSCMPTQNTAGRLQKSMLQL